MSTSKLVYHFISGFRREEQDGSSLFHSGHLPVFRNCDEHGDPLPRPNTLLIDSEQLACRPCSFTSPTACSSANSATRARRPSSTCSASSSASPGNGWRTTWSARPWLASTSIGKGAPP